MFIEDKKEVNLADQVASDASWRSATCPEWSAELQENVELFYTLDLLDMGAGTPGTPWSFNPTTGVFRPGIDTSGNCIDVLRRKLLTATGDHVYFIERRIAEGKCVKNG